jgi:hypothetical protein
LFIPDPDFLSIPDPEVTMAPDPGSGSATMLLYNIISALDCGADDARLLLLAAEAGGGAEGAHLPRLSLRGGGPSASHLWLQVSSPSHSVVGTGLRIHRAPTPPPPRSELR